MTTDTTALVRQMRDAADAIVDRNFTFFSGRMIGADRQITRNEVLAARAAIAAADQWLAQPRGPLADEDITVEAFTKHGYAQGTPGSAMFRKGVRYAERAHSIGQPAGEDKTG